MFRPLAVSSLFVLGLAVAGCSSPAPSCTIKEAADGSATLSCPDGSNVTLRSGPDGVHGKDGESCTASANDDGSYTIACPGSEPIVVRNGADGTGCTLVVVDGTTSLVCTDGTRVVVKEPACGDGVVNDGEICDDGNTSDGDRCSADCVVEKLVPATSIWDGLMSVARSGDSVYVSGIFQNIASKPYLKKVSLSTGETTSLPVGSVYGEGLVATGDGVFHTELNPGRILFAPASGEASTPHLPLANGMVMGLIQVGNELVYPVSSGDAEANGVWAIPMAGGTPRRLGTQNTYELVTDGVAAYTFGNFNLIHRQPLDGEASLVFELESSAGLLAQTLAVSDTEVFAVMSAEPEDEGTNAYLAIPKAGGAARVIAPVDLFTGKIAYFDGSLFVCEGDPVGLVRISTSDGAKSPTGLPCSPTDRIAVVEGDVYWGSDGNVFRAAADAL